MIKDDQLPGSSLIFLLKKTNRQFVNIIVKDDQIWKSKEDQLFKDDQNDQRSPIVRVITFNLTFWIITMTKIEMVKKTNFLKMNWNFCFFMLGLVYPFSHGPKPFTKRIKQCRTQVISIYSGSCPWQNISPSSNGLFGFVMSELREKSTAIDKFEL